MDVNAVCSALAVQARKISNEVTAYDHFPLSVSVPAFIIVDVVVDYDQAYNRGADEISLTAGMLVARADDDAGSRRLYRYVSGAGGGPVKATIEDNPTLSGTCNDLDVSRGRIPRVITVGGKQYWAAEFSIEIDGIGDSP